jgi:1-aminocyclopropane-1-carboxylate deaminase/D-cysteine desulfhydrase-like pyridoxal-dependent ACC family enzyme
VLNGIARGTPTGNARLDNLFGATMHYVGSREERAPMMETIAARLRASGRKPFIVPLGASTAIGAMGFARGVAEIAAARIKPDVIIHATSSGGTQTGLIAGCALFGVRTTIVGISADDPALTLQGVVKRLLAEVAERLGARPASIGAEDAIEIDDTQVGGGYGVPTPHSIEAQALVARREGILLDPVYTAKAMAGLIARIRAGAFNKEQTILFWHTGGTPGYFA